MKFIMSKPIIVALLLFNTLTAFGAAEIGKPAPDFSVAGNDGKTYKLSDFKGKTLILEWYNKDCPFVRKHYNTNNMQTLQKELTREGSKTEWLTVISSAEGKQGYLTPAQATEQIKKEGMHNKAILIDSKGVMGKAYGATTTPHMFIINAKGNVVYAGAIDSLSSSNTADIPKATNYVKNAIEDLVHQRTVKDASTKSYGCSIKYQAP